MKKSSIKKSAINGHNKSKKIKLKNETDQDDRLSDIKPIISALEFLRDEAQRRENKEIYKLINFSFGITLLVHDIIEKNHDDIYKTHK